MTNEDQIADNKHPTEIYAVFHPRDGWIESTSGGLLFTTLRHVAEKWVQRPSNGSRAIRLVPAAPQKIAGATEMNGPGREYIRAMGDTEDAAGCVSVGGMASDFGEPVNVGFCSVEVTVTCEILQCAREVFKNQSTGPETEYERGARDAIEYIEQLIARRIHDTQKPEIP